MPYIEVHVDLDEFDDEELIEELETRGISIETNIFSRDEIDLLLKILDNPSIGSPSYFIAEKLKSIR